MSLERGNNRAKQNRGLLITKLGICRVTIFRFLTKGKCSGIKSMFVCVCLWFLPQHWWVWWLWLRSYLQTGRSGDWLGLACPVPLLTGHIHAIQGTIPPPVCLSNLPVGDRVSTSLTGIFSSFYRLSRPRYHQWQSIQKWLRYSTSVHRSS